MSASPPIALPRLARVRQILPAPRVEDVAGAVRQEVAKLELGQRITQGDSLAITVGSRGIANLALIIKTLVGEFAALGARPFLVPAMGSHGGATAAGQRRVLEDLGVTEEYCGAPIRSSMEVVQLTSTDQGLPVYMDRHAAGADHLVVVGRVKSHTMLEGEVESGLHKMMLIGLGKHQGAVAYHQAFNAHSFDAIVRSVGQAVIHKGRVLMGLAILENPLEQTALIEAVPPERFWDRERELLIQARQMAPRLPFDRADFLVVDQFGKNISGSGMDTTVVGRKLSPHVAPVEVFPKITAIYVRDLTEESHGNATGIGRVEFVHSRMAAKIDWQATYLNCLTAGAPFSARLPMHFDSDREVLERGLGALVSGPAHQARIMRIKNTMDLGQLLISQAYLHEAQEREDLEILSDPEDMRFDGRGDLLDW